MILTRNVIITCGTGGVGKTTVSAALGVRAAMLGRKALVITIDPAKRLVTSLGLDALGDQATDLTPLIKNACEKLGGTCLGSLDALMPDTKKTLEDFVYAFAPTPAAAEKVLKNPIFSILAKEFSGSNEYMALYRLKTLDEMNYYDTIILDTPPSRHTITFLNTPRVMKQFLEERMVRWLLLPTNRIFSAGLRKALGLLEKLTGAGFVTQMLDLAESLYQIQDIALDTVKKLESLLESEKVGFLMVTAPNPETVPELIHLIESLHQYRFRFEGLVLNRTLSAFKISEDEWAQAHQEVERNRPDLIYGLKILDALQTREKRLIEALRNKLANETGAFYSVLPELVRDVHSVEDLYYVADGLKNTQPI